MDDWRKKKEEERIRKLHLENANIIGKYWRRSKEKKVLKTLFILRRKVSHGVMPPLQYLKLFLFITITSHRCYYHSLQSFIHYNYAFISIHMWCTTVTLLATFHREWRLTVYERVQPVEDRAEEAANIPINHLTFWWFLSSFHHSYVNSYHHSFLSIFLCEFLS